MLLGCFFAMAFWASVASADSGDVIILGDFGGFGGFGGGDFGGFGGGGFPNIITGDGKGDTIILGPNW